jgi:peroxiredoxin
MSVNDVFVMDAWGKSQNANEKVLMLADGNGEFTAALGLQLDASGFGMGSRSQRFSLVINDGQVEILNVEDGGEFRVSSCEFMIDQL